MRRALDFVVGFLVAFGVSGFVLNAIGVPGTTPPILNVVAIVAGLMVTFIRAPAARSGRRSTRA